MYFLMSVFLSFFSSKVSAEKAVQKASNEKRVTKRNFFEKKHSRFSVKYMPAKLEQLVKK